MAHDDGYDNSFSYDTENDDLDKERISESLTCKKCAKEFIIGTKGSSELKELCSQCYAAAVDDLLLVEKEVTGDTASDSSNLKDKEVVEDEGKNEDKVDGDDALNETQNYTDANGVDVNSKDFLRLFFTDETSVSMQIGGEEQLYTQKKFHHGPHRCFLDLEVRSVLPLLLNYYLLSAIAMEKERVVFHSRCWIEHKALRRRYILLAILRSKCLHVRYDFILLDPDGNIISLLCGISKMAPFVFLPDVPVDHAAVKEILSRYICDPDNKLALIPGHPDKDEYGHFIVDGFDPLAAALDGGGNSKRKRTQRQVQQGDAVDRTTAKTKTKAKPQTKAKRKSKAKPQAKPQVKKPRKGSAKEPIEVEEDEEDEEEGAEAETEEEEEVTEEERSSPPKKATTSSLKAKKAAAAPPSEFNTLMAEMQKMKAAAEEDKRVRLELEKKIARMERDKASSKSSAAESKDDDVDGSDCASSGSNSYTSVNVLYYEYRDMADDLEMINEIAKLKKDNLLRRKAMNKKSKK